MEEARLPPRTGFVSAGLFQKQVAEREDEKDANGSFEMHLDRGDVRVDQLP